MSHGGWCGRWFDADGFVQKIYSDSLEAFKGIVYKDLPIVLHGEKLKEGHRKLEAWDGKSELTLEQKPNDFGGPFVLLTLESWSPMLRK